MPGATSVLEIAKMTGIGYTRSAVEAVFKSVDKADAKKIVGENAIKVFGLGHA